MTQTAYKMEKFLSVPQANSAFKHQKYLMCNLWKTIVLTEHMALCIL